MVALRRDTVYPSANTTTHRFVVIQGNKPIEDRIVPTSQSTTQIEDSSNLELYVSTHSESFFDTLPKEWAKDAAQRHHERMKTRMAESIEYVDDDMPIVFDGADW